MIRRLFPLRWASILAWTAAAVGWGAAFFGLGDASASSATLPSTPPEEPLGDTVVAAPSTTTSTIPELPPSGLLVIRYTPVPPPPPTEIVRTVRVAPKQQTVRRAPAAPAPTVKSGGS